VTTEMARINYPFAPDQFREILSQGGFQIDFEQATVIRKENALTS